MKRAPIVLTATVAGTAGVLAFHPHTPAVQTATASVATPAATAPAAAAAAATATATATATTRKKPAAPSSATGDAVDTQYGPAQVKVTVRNGKIVNVEAVQLQDFDARSQAISSYAAPILQQEVLTAQSANVSAVSGASYTSASFLQSAQSALDKLGFTG